MSDVTVKAAPKTLQEKMLGMMGIDFAAVQTQMEEAKQIIDDYFVDVNERLEAITVQMNELTKAVNNSGGPEILAALAGLKADIAMVRTAAPARDDSGSDDKTGDGGTDKAAGSLKVVTPKAK